MNMNKPLIILPQSCKKVKQMPDSISLKILDVFRPLFRWLGVDYPVMRNILGMKLMMDQRRQPSILSGSNKKPKGNMFLKSLGVYALYGLFLTPILFLGDNLMFQMSIIFGVTMFILRSEERRVGNECGYGCCVV